jgi:Ca-activated chloride channel family protein
VLLYLNRGNVVFLVVDVSPSMAAGDFSPDRLSAARALIKVFLASRRNEAVGLVAFGGEAALLCPPTLDYATVTRRLESLKPGMLGEGTALGAGIGVAAAHGLSPPRDPPSVSGLFRERHIVVLTDGESNAGAIAPLAAASIAREAGFVVSIVGVGSDGEVPLNYVDPGTGSRRSGVYVSGFDRGALEAIAARGGGGYYDAVDGPALVSAFARISERSLSLSRTRSVATERPLLPHFLTLAFAALALARLLGLASGSELA